MTALATLNGTTGGMVSTTGDYWTYPIMHPTTWPTVWPTTYYYHTCVSYDRGEKAFKLAQALMEKKLVEVRTAKQFIELVNGILEVL